VGTRRTPVVLLLGLAVGLVLADSSVVTLALPEILLHYHVAISTVAWVLTTYNLVLAVTAVPAAYLARRRPVAVCGWGMALFAVASLACALAPSFGVLVAARAFQAAGGAAVVCASLDLLTEVIEPPSRAVEAWALAGVIGAAVGPAAGGILTDVFGWRSIFVVQVPAMLVATLALIRLRAAPVPEPAGRPRVAPNIALALISAALTAALFLLVLLLVNGWGLSPAAAGLAVSVLPVAAIVAGRLARRLGDVATRAAVGVVLIGGGLTALGLLPHASAWWTVPPQILVGAGLGLTISALTARALEGRSPQAVHGGWTIAARHAGVVVGLLILTPVFTADLRSNTHDALVAGTAAVLDSRIPPTAKISVAQDVLAAVDQAKGRVPDVRPVIVNRGSGSDRPLYVALADDLQAQLERAATHAFSRSFLVAAFIGLLALWPIRLRRDEVSV
jgi:MFS family permease